ncbi:hypothetical protein Q7S_09805 [Rahnella aquatilis HX2]|nr:hypothetical protein Q7S_09805 [Rahnella aquatilis HX2]
MNVIRNILPAVMRAFFYLFARDRRIKQQTLAEMTNGVSTIRLTDKRLTDKQQT